MSGFSGFKRKTEELLKDDKKSAELRSTEVAGADIKGNSAIVTIRYNELGDKTKAMTRELYLVKDNGKWKLDFLRQ